MDNKPFWDVNPIRYTATSTHYTAVVTCEVKRMIDGFRNITTEMIADTENYRINEIFTLLKKAPKDTTRQQCIRYLLSYSDLLNQEIAREVINIANDMLKQDVVRDSVKVKIASDLKSFLGTDTKKKRARNTFEELRKEDGILEVEVLD